MSRIELNLDNYPALQNLYETSQQEFAAKLKTTMLRLDEAVALNRFQTVQDLYDMDYLVFLDQLEKAFLDVNGIVQQHHNKGEQEGLAALGTDLHPLAIFTRDAPVYDAQGNNVSPHHWIEQDKFNLKDWLHALFYGARFVSWKELATYLSLGQHDLIDVLKARNFKELAAIQPALAYQEQHGIVKGKLIPGTGFFDCGIGNGDIWCPACKENKLNSKNPIAYCKVCRAGFNNED